MAELFTSKQRSQSRGVPDSESILVESRNNAWQSCGSDGFLIKPLMEDSTKGIRTWLMKVEPGAFSPMHDHVEIEQIFVLEGSFYDQNQTYGPGDYVVRAPGAMHSAGSKDGALVILFYSPA